MTDLTISCTKPDCLFEMNWNDCPGGLAEAEAYFEDWNLNKSDEMECVHDYLIRVMEKESLQ